jgi:predicted ribosome quality control (RQC) complex YloA/Tae2 family protein
MKTENVFIEPLKREIIYYIGKNQKENFEVIDKGTKNDLWFHAANESSCHVVCEVPDDIDKSDMRYIIKIGALLCKSNTNKLKSQKDVKFIYTKIENVFKTEVEGCVQIINDKSIIV